MVCYGQFILVWYAPNICFVFRQWVVYIFFYIFLYALIVNCSMCKKKSKLYVFVLNAQVPNIHYNLAILYL